MATLEYLFFPSNAGFRFSCNCLEYKVATENFSSHKLALMQIALYLLQAVCYCLHLVIRLWLKSSPLLFYSELKRHCLCTVPTCHICTRDHDLREPIPHTWVSSNDNLFQSNFSAWSSREAILGTTPDWPT